MFMKCLVASSSIKVFQAEAKDRDMKLALDQGWRIWLRWVCITAPNRVPCRSVALKYHSLVSGGNKINSDIRSVGLTKLPLVEAIHD